MSMEKRLNRITIIVMMVVIYLGGTVLLKATVIGSWGFNETSGTIVSDQSSNANDGTMYNMDPATDRVAGKIGNALDFDGVDDYVDCGNDSSLLPSGSFTVSAWIYSRGYVNNGSTLNVIVARGNPFADVGGYGFAIDSSEALRFTVNNTSAYSGINIKDRWVYAVGVYDSSESKIKIYIDGELKGEQTGNGLGQDTQTLFFGKDRISCRLFDGLIDEVVLQDIAVSASDVYQLYEQAAIIANWRFNETSGTIVSDQSSNANDGTMYNMDPATDRVAGKIGNALDFDGVDDYVDCGNSATLLPTGSFTLSAWIYSRGYVNNGSTLNVVIARGSPFADVGGYGFAIDSSEALRFTVNNTSVYSGINIKDRWVYAVGVYDSSESKIKIYIDGELEGEQTCNGLGQDTQTLFIGKDRISCRLFNGLIDELRIYSVALDLNGIYKCYTLGNIIGNWHFNEGTGSSITDFSPNGNDGTLTNMDTASCWENSRVGNALDFDGVDDYVDCGNSATLLPTGSFTLSAWIYSDGYVNTGSVYNIPIARGNPFGDAGGYGFAIYSNDKIYFVANGVSVASNVDIKDRWVYVVGVYDSSEGKIKIYIDGVLKGENSFSGLGVDTQALHIGKGKYSTRMFNGLIDEVQIYNVAITPRPFATLKVFHNNDLINVAGWTPSNPITNAILDANFDSVQGKVDVHMLSPGFCWVPFWISSVYNAAQHYTDWETATGNTCNAYGSYMKAGGDILQEFINRCRATGQSPFASIRLNDTHQMDYLDPQNPNNPYTQWISDFCWEHIDDLIDSQNTRSGWNWAVPAVPAHKLALIEEICENYDIDGIELDFLRFPAYFDTTETTSEERRIIINKFVSDVRTILDETADEGQYRWLVVRVPCHLLNYDDMGLNLISMADIGVDIFNISPFFYNTQQGTDIAEIRQMIPNKCLLYELEYATFTDADGYNGRIPTPDEQLYTTAHLMYQHGVDGIEWFNFDYFSQFGISKPYYLLENIGDPELMASRQQQWYFQSAALSTELPQTYTAGVSYTYTLDLALTDDLSSGDGLFRLMTEDDCSGCSWSVSINGQTLTGTSFVSMPIAHQYTYPAMTDYTRYRSFLVPQSILHDGINSITIEMTSGNSQILCYYDLALPPDN